MKLCLTEELSDFQKQGMLGNTPQVFSQIVTGYHPPLESKGGGNGNIKGQYYFASLGTSVHITTNVSLIVDE